MKRNWELLRSILNQAESCQGGLPIVLTNGIYGGKHIPLSIGELDFGEVCEHILLLGDADLAEVRELGRTDKSEADLSLVTPSDTETKDDDVSQSDRQITVDSNTMSHQTTIDRIRSESQEDKYHCLLNEPDYSNDTHDWSDDIELVRARLLPFSWQL